MSVIAASGAPPQLSERIAQLPWTQLASDLDATGMARIPALLSIGECNALAASYADAALFRSRITQGNFGMATGESLAHLNCLRFRGRMQRTADKNGIDWYEAI